ncbi:MAG: surA [Gammaproteobacteria bacterium]|jgi:peptidyl-prolyl cis-trans isomerase SurA|nr:surA [Gammaproteobacteria bacterium]MCE3238197.1 surA [Gammaproteobacteria bacterium]
MNIIKFSVILLCSLLVMNNAVFGATSKNEEPLDVIVAIVNKTIITQSELEDAINRIEKQLLASHTPIPSDTILRKQVLDQLIDRKLQLDLAEQAGVRVTDEDITKAINEVARKNHITTDRLLAAVADQGLNTSEYRREIRDEIAISQIAHQMIGNKITVSEQEVDDFMRSAAWLSYNGKEYHLEDILIALPEKTTPQDIADAMAHAKTLLEKIHNGVSFHEAAAADSHGSKALQGGDLGWRKLPEIPSAFAGKLVTMKENDVAGPIRTANGFHIIHVAGVRHAGMQGNQANQRKQVQQLLYQRKYEEALQNWVTRLRSEAFIKYTSGK